MKKVFLGVTIATIFSASVCAVEVQPKKPNILVISLCSLRKDVFKIFAPNNLKTPHLDQFVNGSMIFANANNGNSWNGVFRRFKGTNNNWLEKNGYKAIHGHYFAQDPKYLEEKKKLGIVVAPIHITNVGAVSTSTFISQTADQLSHYSADKPYFAITHLQFLHFPFSRELDDPFLNKQEDQIFSGNLENKVPFLFSVYSRQYLWQKLKNKKMTFANKLNDQNPGGAGHFEHSLDSFELISDPRYLKKWKDSSHFSNDLKVAREVYNKKIEALDKLIAPLLVLPNTIVVLMSDHGEPFFEKGKYIFGDDVYEVSTEIPAFIHFPDNQKSIFEKQVSMDLIARLIGSMIEGQNSFGQASRFLVENNEKYIWGYNCSGNLFSIKFNDHYVFIHDVASNKNEYYDLSKDPKQEKNIITQLPINIKNKLIKEVESFMAQNQTHARLSGCVYNVVQSIGEK